MVLFLYRVNSEGFGSFNLKHINDNFVNITYISKSDISLKINKNKNDISTNLKEINNIKNNKIYLKNVYNILFYDKKLKLILVIYSMKRYLMLILIKIIL